MTVIKATDLLARRVRAPVLRPPASAPPLVIVVDSEKAALEAEVARLSAEMDGLRARLQAREARVTELEDGLAGALAVAEARGREAGVEAGAEAKAEALLILQAACVRASQQVRDDLRGMETLAVALAKAALAKVFGESGEMAQRVAKLVRRQLDGLDRAAVLGVEVSATDFPDAPALEALLAAADLEGVALQASDGLEPGDCRIRLKLGELEVGIGQQWGRLSTLLDETLAAEDDR